MRVLHMPVNTASIAYTTVKALRASGHDAHGIVFASTDVQSFDVLDAVPLKSKKRPYRVALSLIAFASRLRAYLRHNPPDIVHWYFSWAASTLDIDIKILRSLRLPGVVEWTGADIRIPEIEFQENPYYTRAYNQGYEYREAEGLTLSQHRQKRFADIGYASIAATGMMQYLLPDISQTAYRVEQRLLLSEYEAHYPSVENECPVIVHSPTARVTKGTEYVLQAVEQLRTKYTFDFRLIQGMPHQQALIQIQGADIFLDQFILGDRGIASLEAMAFGKPVVCYIKPSLASAYPQDMPIINANPDNLVFHLEQLLKDGMMRHKTGRASRLFVEKYHAADVVMPALIEVYQSVIDAHNRLNR